MVTSVTIRRLKRFNEETFELGEAVVLAGPNNSGKTTLLQAVRLPGSSWNFDDDPTGIVMLRR